jgi:hypothetical protein
MSRDQLVAALLDPETAGTLVAICFVIGVVAFVAAWVLGA